MSNIDKYAQFITQQKEKNDFGYNSKIDEGGWSGVNSKKYQSLTDTSKELKRKYGYVTDIEDVKARAKRQKAEQDAEDAAKKNR